MLPVLRTITSRIGRYEVIAFITGFVLMAFELAASRILAPTIGTSIYVWTSVIGVMIAALAVGYAVGGWVADRRAKALDIAWLLLATALAIFVTCMLSQIILKGVSTTIDDVRLQGVIASIILFVPASFLLGMVSPYLAKLRVQSIHTTGRSVAGLGAANSLGGITGTFCVGFIFFAVIGSRETLVLLAGILIATSWLVMPRISRKNRAIASLVLACLLLLQFATPASASVVATIDTPTSHYKIVDTMLHGQPARALVMGPGGLQSAAYLDGSKELVFDYTRKIAEVVAAAPHKQRILILGGGAFSLPEYLGDHYPTSQVDVVEIDSKLPAIAAEYFAYQQPPNVAVFAEDARTFLQKNTTPYDVIIVDVYSDAFVPFALSTQEYAAALKKSLSPHGIVAANIIGASTPGCLPLLTGLHASYSSAFSQSAFYPVRDITMQTRQNIIAAYAGQPITWNSVIDGETFVSIDQAKTKLTDNYAPVEHLQQQCR